MLTVTKDSIILEWSDETEENLPILKFYWSRATGELEKCILRCGGYDPEIAANENGQIEVVALHWEDQRDGHCRVTKDRLWSGIQPLFEKRSQEAASINLSAALAAAHRQALDELVNLHILINGDV